MKPLYFFVTLLVFSNSIWSQNVKTSAPFDWNSEHEGVPTWMLKDNYNHYLASLVNVSGMLSRSEFIIRKFDHENQLVNTFTHSFKSKDLTMYHNAWGPFEWGNDEVVVFTELYLRKGTSSSFSMIVFNKNTSSFTTQELNTYSFESISKKGNFDSAVSQNGRYLALIFKLNESKKEPNEFEYSIYDLKEKKLIKKENHTFNDEFFNQEWLVSNRGELYILRAPRSYKLENHVVLVSDGGITKFEFESPIKLHRPEILSIGDQDYLLGFNYPQKGIRRGDFGNLLFYDLKASKTLNNSSINNFNAIKDINAVEFQNFFITSDGIEFFAEAKVKSGVKPSPNSMNPNFGDPIYKRSNSTYFKLDLTGQIVKQVELGIGMSPTIHSESVGILNYQGKWYFQSGRQNSFFNWDPNKDVKTRTTIVGFNSMNENYSSDINTINQSHWYQPETKKYRVLMNIGDDKLRILTYSDLSL